MRTILNSPHFYGASVLARLVVNAVTIVWCVIVIVKRDALASSHAAYAWIGEYVEENALATGLFVLCCVQIIWLVAKLPPLRSGPIVWGSLGYGLLSAFWLFVTLSAALAPTGIQPTATALGFGVAAMAVYAFVSNPKPNAEPI